MSGNGLFLNINLYAPADSKNLPIGTYQTSDTINDFTILPGALRQEGNSYYATGSYLGQYTDNGLSALFLTEGEITIENNGNYSVVCSFSGAQAETIDATFNGSIDIYDTSEENQTTIIEYTEATAEAIEIINESTLNHIQISLIGNDTTVTFVARTPKSVNTLPEGNYYMSDNIMAYTLLPNDCYITSKEEKIAITSATLQVKENRYQANFTDINGIKYLFPDFFGKKVFCSSVASFGFMLKEISAPTSRSVSTGFTETKSGNEETTSSSNSSIKSSTSSSDISIRSFENVTLL
jgi:hypothetical protein